MSFTGRIGPFNAFDPFNFNDPPEGGERAIFSASDPDLIVWIEQRNTSTLEGTERTQAAIGLLKELTSYLELSQPPEMAADRACAWCQGSGHIVVGNSIASCGHCKSTGRLPPLPPQKRSILRELQECPDCSGVGVQPVAGGVMAICSSCGASGYQIQPMPTAAQASDE